ncbi:caspase family protein [Bradyrhizobium barranii]|uniref:caspase family protein n=1 Tax=Bradyrhizobium barranii TaxID=2992140 RepID=UPI0040332103
MRMPRGFYCGIRQLCATIGLAALIGLITPHAYAAGGLSISNPDGAAVRALVIGIDDYQHVRKLKGAVADATDIVTSLKNMGVGDVVVLTNAQADRASVLREISALVERTKNNDLIFLSIAGHGTQEPERVKGSEPDGMENVFLLPGFETTPTGSVERVLGSEFNHFIRQFELRGARVIFVADTCHGGGMVRDIDPRAAEMSFRQVPRYTLLVDELKPVSDSNDPKSELDLDHTAFLAAVDRYTKAPEVRIPGIDGLRGALSYAVARAVEGSADINHDGKVTLKELFSNVRQVVYQLSDQRQNIVTISSPPQTPDTDVAFELTRGVVLIQGPAARAASGPAGSGGGRRGTGARATGCHGQGTNHSDPCRGGDQGTSDRRRAGASPPRCTNPAGGARRQDKLFCKREAKGCSRAGGSTDGQSRPDLGSRVARRDRVGRRGRLRDRRCELADGSRSDSGNS